MTGRQRPGTASGVIFLTLEDESGVAEGVLFPPAYERWGHLLTHRGPFYVSGVVQDQMGACVLDIDRIDG